MIDVITLSELSDEPGERNMFGYDFSPRLKAVLDRMPNNSTGTATRVKGGLYNLGIFTLAALVAADRYTLGRKHLGPTSCKAIDAALKKFGLHRIDENPPIVVAYPAEAYVLRLQRWIAERMAMKTSFTEREVLRDVMLVLDGRDPTNVREWADDEPGDLDGTLNSNI